MPNTKGFRIIALMQRNSDFWAASNPSVSFYSIELYVKTFPLLWRDTGNLVEKCLQKLITGFSK
jgi:hypothetical protein